MRCSRRSGLGHYRIRFGGTLFPALVVATFALRAVFATVPAGLIATIVVTTTAVHLGGFDDTDFLDFGLFARIMERGDCGRRVVVIAGGAIIAPVAVLGLLGLAVLLAPAMLAALQIATLLTVALLTLTGRLFAGQFGLRFAQHPGVVLGVLQKILLGHTVVAQLSIAGQLEVFVDDLLRRTTHLALGTRAVKDAVDDVADRALPVRLRTRTILG